MKKRVASLLAQINQASGEFQLMRNVLCFQVLLALSKMLISRSI